MKMKLLLCAAIGLFSASALAQVQSGSGIRSGTGLTGPSTGTSGDTAGATGTTAPRRSASPETSVGVSGATSPSSPNRSSGLCDTLTGEERIKCQREQASTGSAGAGSTGAASGTTGNAGVGGGATPGTSRGR